MSDDPLIDHLERTFAEVYHKEIDQEENVWRRYPTCMDVQTEAASESDVRKGRESRLEVVLRTLRGVEPPPMVVRHEGWFRDREVERPASELAAEERERRR